MWPGLTPPYLELFAWLEGRGEKPVNRDPAPFRPVMLAHAIEDADFAGLDAADFIAEWKWDGIRVQAVSGREGAAYAGAALFAQRRGHHREFSDLLPSLHLAGAIDGELLVLRDGRVQTFNVLQQRLNRKVVSPKLTMNIRSICAPTTCSAKAAGPARAALCRAPQAAGSLRQQARRSAHRPVADDRLRELGGAGVGARRSRRPAPAKMPRPSKA